MKVLVKNIADCNKHAVVIVKDDEMRCYFLHYSQLVACEVANKLKRDIAQMGESFVDFTAHPRIVMRLSKTKRKVFDIE